MIAGALCPCFSNVYTVQCTYLKTFRLIFFIYTGMRHDLPPEETSEIASVRVAGKIAVGYAQ